MKISISTKPFLSFFICLATFIAHSSPSLSTSRNLHKRMEGLLVKSASLANRLEETRVGESARGGYVEATENLEGPGFTSRPVMEELHHTNQAPVKPIGEVTARGFVSKYLSMPLSPKSMSISIFIHTYNDLGEFEISQQIRR
jgi:hypothetical protein